MNSVCPGCQGTGKVLIDCPYCRIFEEPDNEENASRVCLNCHNKGVVEDMCPLCKGTGKVLEKDSILKV